MKCPVCGKEMSPEDYDTRGTFPKDGLPSELKDREQAEGYQCHEHEQPWEFLRLGSQLYGYVSGVWFLRCNLRKAKRIGKLIGDYEVH
jgi:hypothetical protein